MASNPFVGEIIIAGFNFAPRGFAFCDGQIMSIATNTALFSLLGTIYGGDGRSTFGLPDLRGRVSFTFGNGPGLSNYQIGQKGGEERHTLTELEMPAHNHTIQSNNGGGTENTPVNNFLAGPSADRNQVMYNDATTGGTVNLNANAIAMKGSGGSHNNMMPYLAVNYCIALQGVFPSRN